MSQDKIIQLFPSGTVTLPPSKSLSHRAVICAALAAADGGESLLFNVGQSQDIAATLNCMAQLGARFETAADGTIRVLPGEVLGKDRRRPLDCGESGSTLRFLIPLAAMTDGAWQFTGRGRLMQRPLGVYADIFKEAGARFEQDGEHLLVQGPLLGGTYTMPGDVSSQFLSGLLLALPLAGTDSTIQLTSPLESAAYVNLTLDVMADFGISVHKTPSGSYHIPGKQRYTPASYTVEGDWSQAAFFLGAGALGRPVTCAGLSPQSHQGDAAITDVLTQMGVQISWQGNLVTASSSGLLAAVIDARPIPDLVPPLATLCSFAAGTSRIINAGRLRIKESDRLASMASELTKLGADVREEPDSLIITGKPMLQGGCVQAHNDHRIAMAMAVAAIRCTQPVRLNGWESVAKSYPTFWDDFEKEARHG